MNKSCVGLVLAMFVGGCSAVAPSAPEPKVPVPSDQVVQSEDTATREAWGAGMVDSLKIPESQVRDVTPIRPRPMASPVQGVTRPAEVIDAPR